MNIWIFFYLKIKIKSIQKGKKLPLCSVTILEADTILFAEAGKKIPNQQLFICYQTKTVKKSKKSIPAQKPELFDLSGLGPGQLAKLGFFLRTARGQRLRKDAHCSWHHPLKARAERQKDLSRL